MDTLDAANILYMVAEDNEAGVALMSLPTKSAMGRVEDYLEQGYRFVTKDEYDDIRQNVDFPH